MEHSHHHSSENATKNISLAFFLNVAFAAIELVGGLLTNSVAILSDALHDTGDSISLGIAWWLQKKSNKKIDQHYSYGYKRFSLLGAIFISVVLIVSSVFIIRESIKRIMDPQTANAEGMLLLAIFGILVNGYAAYKLNRGHSLSERAVALHLLEDVFGWIAVLIVSIVMLFVDVPVLDPLLSIGITIWVLTNVYRNLRDTFKVLMQEVPHNVDIDRMLLQIKEIKDVRGVHDFHLWSLDGEHNIMTLHVVTGDIQAPDKLVKLKQEIRELAATFNVQHVTLEFEDKDEANGCEFINGCDDV